jgi:cellulose biosynthesis protein BcsQ
LKGPAIPNPNSRLIVSFVSGKGGVGKTMLAVAFAKELSFSNRTLIIDLDFFNRGLTGLMGPGIKKCEVNKPAFLLEEGSQDFQSAEKWSVSQISENFFHLVYPDLVPDEMSRFETIDVHELKESLQAFIEEIRSLCDCDCVVLDCHGGPDSLSFAACLIADYSLLISEPDRITFYGTLNFLRQLKRVGGDQVVNLRLVYNKVVPAFSALFLRTMYNRMMRKHFFEYPLLAVFPLEVYLTKEFEKTPFLTSVYPDSWLAKKTRTLIYDLLSNEYPEKLSQPIQSMPKWMRVYRKYSLGKAMPLLDLNFVMYAIVACLVFMVLLDLTLSQFFQKNRQKLRSQVKTVVVLQCLKQTPDLTLQQDQLSQLIDSEFYSFWSQYENRYETQVQVDKFRDCIRSWNSDYYSDYGLYSNYYGLAADRRRAIKSFDANSVTVNYNSMYREAIDGLKQTSLLYLSLQTLDGLVWPLARTLAYLGACWLAAVLLLSWTSQLDRRFTYYSRERKYYYSLIPLVLAFVLWLLPLIGLGIIFKNIFRLSRLIPSDLQEWLLFSCFTLAFVVPVALIVVQLFRVYRDIRYEHHYVENGMRMLFVAYLALIPVLILRFAK